MNIGYVLNNTSLLEQSLYLNDLDKKHFSLNHETRDNRKDMHARNCILLEKRFAFFTASSVV